jgi:hypothetical protein
VRNGNCSSWVNVPVHIYFVYFLIQNSAWAFAASSMVIGIYGGGPAVEIWGTLAIGAALSVFCLNLAEYGSAFPNAGGCTYIATQLGGPKYGRMAVRNFSVREGVLRLIKIGLLHWCFPFFHCRLYSSSFDPSPFRDDFHLRLLFPSTLHPKKADLGTGETGRTQGSEGWLPGN